MTALVLKTTFIYKEYSMTTDLSKVKIICAPDSFKGSMTSAQACSAMEEGLINAGISPENIVRLPIADGGEGTTDTFLSFMPGGEKIFADITDSYGNEKKGYFAWFEEKKTAVLEMATATGLSERKEALYASSFGTGTLIKAAIEQGAKHIIMGIGGTSSTDAGVGAAAALGAEFFDKDGNDIPLCGSGLKSIDKIYTDKIKEKLDGCRFTILCDVKNTLYGKQGAAYVYSPQKGATPEEVEILDEGLRNFAEAVKKNFGTDISEMQGGGAAGGMGAGASVFFNAELKPGIETILELADFDKNKEGASLILFGEGKFDSQSLNGKVFSGLSDRSAGIPIGVLCGKKDIDGIPQNAAFIEEIAPGVTLEDSIANGYVYLKNATERVIRKYTEADHGKKA